MPTTLISRDRRLRPHDLVSLIEPRADDPHGFRVTPPATAPVREGTSQHGVFSVTERGSRMACIALVETIATGRVAGRVASPLQQFAGQGHAWVREPVALNAIVSNEACDSALGTVVSVSEEGCVIATPMALLGDELEVLLKFRCYTARIACQRIGTSLQEHGGEPQNCSSLQYRDLKPAQVAFLRLLLDRHIQESAPLQCY